MKKMACKFSGTFGPPGSLWWLLPTLPGVEGFEPKAGQLSRPETKWLHAQKSSSAIWKIFDGHLPYPVYTFREVGTSKALVATSGEPCGGLSNINIQRCFLQPPWHTNKQYISHASIQQRVEITTPFHRKLHVFFKSKCIKIATGQGSESTHWKSC